MAKNQGVRKGFPTKKSSETSHFSVYDGHRHLGSVIGNKAAGFKAIPLRGKSLGAFQTIKAAADSLSAAGAMR